MMKLHKKGQAILPFFALQLVSMMIFIIVLLVLLTMAREVKLTVNEFDERTSFLLAGRRLFASSDCLAYESRDMIFDTTQNVLLTGSKVNTGVIDQNKLFDFENFNCLRKDYYDLQEDVESGYIDAVNATGGAFKYDIIVIDLVTKQNVTNPQVQTSLVARVLKSEQDCHKIDTAASSEHSGLTLSYTGPCVDKFGGDFSCIYVCNYEQTTASDPNCNKCDVIDSILGKIGSPDCFGNIDKCWTDAQKNFEDSGITKDDLQRCISAICSDDTAFINMGCKYGRCEQENDEFFSKPLIEPNAIGILWNTTRADENSADYAFSGVTVVDPHDIRDKMDFNQNKLNCEGKEGVQSAVFLTMLKTPDDVELHPAVLILKTCVVKGSEFENTPILELTQKPKPGSDCFG
jgi:hypothetical protein